MKIRLFPLLGAAAFAILVLCVAPAAQAACCGGCNTLVSGSCCNVFSCNCDGPCTNFGCGCPPDASSDYCGVCPSYYTLIYNGACAYTTGSVAATAVMTGQPSAVQPKGPVLMLSAATPEAR